MTNWKQKGLQCGKYFDIILPFDVPKGVYSMKFLKGILVLVLILTTILCVACSGKGEANTEKPEANSGAGEAGTEIYVPGAVEAPDGQQSDAQQGDEQDEKQPELTFENPLTGLMTTEEIATTRPVAIMVNNIHAALPQIGISEAEVIYEILEEGGITRLLCVYNDYKDIPEIGSIRSARDYFIDFADAHDAVFIHAGGSTYAKQALIDRRTNNLDGLYLDQFYRSAERQKIMSREHTLMISGSGICEAMALKGYSTTTEKKGPFTFGDVELDGESAQYIEIPFSLGYNPSPYAVTHLNYDSEKGAYLKGQYGAAHIDGDDNTQLEFKNVLTLTCSMSVIPGDEYGCLKMSFNGTGKGTYACDGVIKDIVWKKNAGESTYTLYESDGQTPLILNKGKSYIAVVPVGTQIKVQ